MKPFRFKYIYAILYKSEMRRGGYAKGNLLQKAIQADDRPKPEGT